MADIPEKIKRTFEALKIAYGSYIELKHLNKRFCVFEATSRYDAEAGRSKKISHYLGWITDDGLMVPAKQRNKPESLRVIEENYIEKISNLNQKLEYESKNSKNFHIAPNGTINGHDIKLITALSMNSRIPYKILSKITKIPIKNLPYIIKRAESEFGIKYTEEINVINLGFSKYFILVKFIDAMPSPSGLKNALESEDRVQLAILTKGIYDMIVYCVAENNEVLANMLDRIRKSNQLINIQSEWRVTPVEEDYGFVPIRENFFNIIKERVWHRTKEHPKPSKSDIRHREYAVLKEFNVNSRISFAEIDKKYQMPNGSAKNAYERLSGEEANVILRPTISIQKPNMKYNGIIMIDILNKAQFLDTRDVHRKYVIGEPESTLNRFSYICDFETPDGIMYLLPIYEDGQLDDVQRDLNSILSGIRSDYMIVSEILIGSINYRKFDNLYSIQYEGLLRRKSVEPKERTDYALHARKVTKRIFKQQV